MFPFLWLFPVKSTEREDRGSTEGRMVRWCGIEIDVLLKKKYFFFGATSLVVGEVSTHKFLDLIFSAAVNHGWQ